MYHRILQLQNKCLMCLYFSCKSLFIEKIWWSKLVLQEVLLVLWINLIRLGIFRWKASFANRLCINLGISTHQSMQPAHLGRSLNPLFLAPTKSENEKEKRHDAHAVVGHPLPNKGVYEKLLFIGLLVIDFKFQ